MNLDERTERWLLAIEGRCIGRSVHEGKLEPPGFADQEFRFEDMAGCKQITLRDAASGKTRIYRLSKAADAPPLWQHADSVKLA